MKSRAALCKPPYFIPDSLFFILKHCEIIIAGAGSRHTFGQTIVAREARHHINRRQRRKDEYASSNFDLMTVNASPLP